MYYDEFVFMGDHKELLEGDLADTLNYVAEAELYHMDTHKVGFYYNSDPACREAHGIDTEKSHIVIYNGFNTLPQHVTVGDDYISYQTLLYALNQAIVKGTPRWSQRAYMCLYEFGMNGIVFMMEKGALSNIEQHKDDWRVALMVKVTEWTQENESSYLPIIG